MYILLFGLAPLVVLSGLVHVVLASRRLLVQLCLFVTPTLAAGIFTTAMFRARVAEAVRLSRPWEHLGLAVTGYAEANRPFELALVIVLAGLLLYTVGEPRRMGKTPRS